MLLKIDSLISIVKKEITNVYIYKENLERCWAFYKSSFYKYLKENHEGYPEHIFTYCCLDADACDKELYMELGKKFSLEYRSNYLIENINGEKIRLSADVICGRKQLATLRNNDFLLWHKDYEYIRGNVDFHFIWPKHKAPTINTLRYTIYRDRIDCLLYDLKMYFEGEITPMNNAYENGTTKLWLSKFKNFQNFVVKMKFNDYVDDKHNVYDISKNDGSFIDKYILRSDLYGTIESYLKNI